MAQDEMHYGRTLSPHYNYDIRQRSLSTDGTYTTRLSSEMAESLERELEDALRDFQREMDEMR